LSNPKQWVDDYNRKVLNLPAMGGCASLVFSPNMTQKGFNIGRMADLFIPIGGERLVSHEKGNNQV
jgi:hypothetical protein